MPEIDFSAFTPRSFEQFAQALSAKVFGAGILIFGDGPDGGREAEFDGEVPYPNAVERWAGLTIMQAKYCERPKGDRRDAEWLVEQLRGECEKLAASPGRKIPRQMVLVTNVRLSGVPETGRGSGGQAKLNAAFGKLARPLGIKKLDIWHAEKLAVLLDAHPDLARAYKAWLTPREALAAALEGFEGSRPSFASTIRRYTMREFRGQATTRLQQAGHPTEDATKLEQVFVDLPCRDLGRTGDGRSSIAGLDDRETAVAMLLDRLGLKLDVTSLSASNPREAMPARHLLLGGPGQGKSTVTQFLGQVMRWRLLLDEPLHLLGPEIARGLDEFGLRASELGITAAGLRRYPIRIDLPGFADTLERAVHAGDNLSLLAHVAAEVTKIADETVTVQDMRAWLGAHPWLLLLDGLDEVPPSGNRAAVIDAIVRFWDEVDPLQADVALIVTTRPQGYNDDLDPALYRKMSLTPLDAARALDYATRLANVRLAPDRRGRVLERLTEAAGRPATSSLLVSPLQVAILFQLVDQRGVAPTDRWTLFSGYAAIVTAREQEKPGPSGAVIRDHHLSIEKLLRRVGLLLHVEAERGGAASSKISVELVNAIVQDILNEDGYDEAGVTDVASEIVSAATDRLVFLAQREEGQLAFDVRSLQEYAAAAEIMSGREVAVSERLHEIAGRTHWQHVYKIAASKAFSTADAGLFRDVILSTNRMVDVRTLGEASLARGALLALELLEDGLAIQQPNYRRQMLSHALATLRSANPETAGRLVIVFKGCERRDLDEVALADHLTALCQDRRRVAWRFLATLSASGAAWADDIGTGFWPAHVDLAVEAATCGMLPSKGPLLDLFQTALLQATPKSLARGMAALDFEDTYREILELVPQLKIFKNSMQDRSTDAALIPDHAGAMRLQITTIEAARKAYEGPFPTGELWVAPVVTASFLSKPSKNALAAWCDAVLRTDTAEILDDIVLPWVLTTVVQIFEYEQDVNALTELIMAGGLGDLEDWTDAERRWTDDGVRDVDLDIWREGAFFRHDVGSRGAPMFEALVSSTSMLKIDLVSSLVRRAIEAEEGPPRKLLEFLARVAVRKLPEPSLGADELLELVLLPLGRAAARRRFLDTSVLVAVQQQAFADERVKTGLVEIVTNQMLTLNHQPSASTLVKHLMQLLIEEDAPDEYLAVLAALGGENGVQFAEAVTELGTLVERSTGSGLSTMRQVAVLAQAIRGEASEAAVCAEIFCDEDNVAQWIFIALARTVHLKPDIAEAGLVAAMAERSRNTGVKSRARLALASLIDKRMSNVAEERVWARLDLPPRLHARLRFSL